MIRGGAWAVLSRREHPDNSAPYPGVPALTRTIPVKVTFLGHVGMYIETKHGSVLCDPLFNSAYFGSWWTFPANDQLDFAVSARKFWILVSKRSGMWCSLRGARHLIDGTFKACASGGSG